MNDGRKYEIKDAKESLHWISYNLTSISKNLKVLIDLLEKSTVLEDPIRKKNPLDNSYDEMPF